jgi:hypothetical protein
VCRGEDGCGVEEVPFCSSLRRHASGLPVPPVSWCRRLPTPVPTPPASASPSGNAWDPTRDSSRSSSDTSHCVVKHHRFDFLFILRGCVRVVSYLTCCAFHLVQCSCLPLDLECQNGSECCVLFIAFQGVMKHEEITKVEKDSAIRCVFLRLFTAALSMFCFL